MKWKHKFYQKDPDTNYECIFYHSQRVAYAILEVVKELKNNYYEAKVVSIESDENFHIMGQVGGCTYQYKIGDIFTLRRHNENKRKFNKYYRGFWYDPRNPSHPHTENFELIEDDKIQNN